MSKSAEFFAEVVAGQIGRVRQLLDSDPTLAQAKDGGGATPLHHAADHGNRKLVALLLERGADINARDDEWSATPTGWSIEYLREQGGLLAIEIEDLLVAIRAREGFWVQRWLTRLPALAKARDSQGKPLAQHARESGSEEIARLFEDPSAGNNVGGRA